MKRKVRRFDEGGDVVAGFRKDGNDRANARALEGGTGLKRETFSDAFARARRMGDKTFEFKGKTYGTALKGESASKSETAGKAKGQSFPLTDLRQDARDTLYKNRSDDYDAAKRRLDDAKFRLDETSTKEQRKMADYGAAGLSGMFEPRGAAARSRGKIDSALVERNRAASDEAVAKEKLDDTPKGGDYELGIKRGGAIKAKKYAKGGSVSSASKRADGCAVKGKTKGRMY